MVVAWSGAPIEQLRVSVFDIPTDKPESDGTLSWDKTTLLLVAATAGGMQGIGYSYTSGAAAKVVEGTLRPVVAGLDVMAIPAAWEAMRRAIRNLGQPGIAFNALSAVDAALWDLKGKLLGLPVVTLLGSARQAVPAYGSGGFTSYDDRELCAQLGGFAERGFEMVKMKVGRDAQRDRERVRAVRSAIGPRTALFVDANGAYDRKLALAQAQDFSQADVNWFEEPVSSDDLAGLRLLRDRGPAGMQIAAGEYGYTPDYFRRMLEAEAVDVLQADATRCGGITGLLIAGALTAARSLDLSCHCAPTLHLHVGCAVPRLAHLEYFYDHARVEHMLFDGCPRPQGGTLEPDRSRPGLGIELKRADAERFTARA